MGLVNGLLTLPLAPVRGVVWLGEQLQAEARRQLLDPGAVRRRLDDLELAHQRGEITDEQRAEHEDQLMALVWAEQAGGR